MEDAQPERMPLDRSAAVALITLARYLHEKDRGLGGYLREALVHARQMKVSEADLQDLKLMIGAIPPS